MSLPSVETARDWPAKPMVDREGDPLGRITYIYLDRVTGQPTWALVATGGVRRRRAFVPLAQAVRENDQVRVPVPGAEVRRAPGLRRRGELPQKHEARLLEHYGELAGLASSRSGARRAPMGAEAGARFRRRSRQGLEQAMEGATDAGASRGPGRWLAGGLGLAGSLAATRLLTRRGRARKGLLAASKAAGPWRRSRAMRRGPVVIINARPARPRRVPSQPPRLPSQRRSPSMAGDLKLALGFAGGYLLGARAGRERYQQIAEQARRFWQRPETQNQAAKGRETTRAGVEQAAGRAGGGTSRSGGGERPTTGS